LLVNCPDARTARSDTRKALLLGLFGVAMGYVEAAVVVYLRRIYYPQGFAFPLNSAVLDRMFLVEPGRELATIIMLSTIAILAGRKRLERFAWFLFIFATWDVFYYVWLKVLLNWPPSLLTWDILFLIPLPWAAPVLSPVLVAASMAAWGLMLARSSHQPPATSHQPGHILRPRLGEWLMTALGALAILGSFLSDYAAVVMRSTDRAAQVAAHVPSSYPWWLFAFGLALLWAAFLRVSRRNAKAETRNP
jgi:hypothetical protein